MPRFVFEADFRHDFKELIEQIDDRRAPVIAENAIEQRHLTACVGDVDRPDQIRKTAGEGGLAGIKIVTDQRAPAHPQEIDQEAAEQRSPNTRVSRGDNVELRLLRHARFRSSCERAVNVYELRNRDTSAAMLAVNSPAGASEAARDCL